MKGLLLLVCLSPAGFAQEKTETRELVGQLGNRSALLDPARRRSAEDGGWQLTGEYIVLPTLQRRFLEGERSPQIGVTTLQGGHHADPLRPPADRRAARHLARRRVQGHALRPGRAGARALRVQRGIPVDGRLQRAAVRCEAGDGRYAAALALRGARAASSRSSNGASKLAPSGHSLHGSPACSSSPSRAACGSPPGAAA